MGVTSYGLIVALKKKELTSALGKSNKAERNEWRARIDFMDAAAAGEAGGDDGEEGAA